MQGRGRPKRDDEPAVTFELEETPRSSHGRRPGVAAGAAAAAGAGLVSSAAASQPDDSLDVFDQLDESDIESGGVPVTSFQELAEAGADSEFPPIEFTTTDDDAAGTETTHGASADVGGGFVLEDGAGDAAFGATDTDIEPVPDSLVDDDPLDDELEAEVDSLEDDIP